MTWDEIRAAYPNQRIYVSAIDDGFDGTLVRHQPLDVLEPVPTDEKAARLRLYELQNHHGIVVAADTSQSDFVVPPVICTFRRYRHEDEQLDLPPMRVIVRHVSNPSRVD